MENMQKTLQKNKTKYNQLTTYNLQLTTLDIRKAVIRIIGEDMIATSQKDMTAYYCKCFKTLGEGTLVMAVQSARTAKQPIKALHAMLGQEMRKKERCNVNKLVI